MTQAILPALMESAPRSGPDRPLFQDLHRRGQGAGAQQEREVVGLLDGEIAGNLPVTADDGLANYGRADDLGIQHDGEGLADVLGRYIAKLPRTGGIEAEADGPLPGLVARGRRIDQRIAAHHDPLADHVEDLLAVGVELVAGQPQRAQRHAA